MSTTLTLTKWAGPLGRVKVEYTYTLEELAQAVEKEGKLCKGRYFDDHDGTRCILGLMYFELTDDKYRTLLSLDPKDQRIESRLLRLNDETIGTPEHRAEVMVVKVRELDLSLGGIS